MNGVDERFEPMPCDAAREQLLVADLDELQGLGDSRLAHHVRRCERCRALAGRILVDQQALNLALTELGRARSSRMTSMTPRGVGRPDDDRGFRRRWSLRAALPIAAAAALAALLLLPPALRRGRVIPPGDTLRDVSVVALDPTAAGDRPSLQVEAPAEGRMAVFETRDPSITVVWFY